MQKKKVKGKEKRKGKEKLSLKYIFFCFIFKWSLKNKKVKGIELYLVLEEILCSVCNKEL